MGLGKGPGLGRQGGTCGEAKPGFGALPSGRCGGRAWYWRGRLVLPPHAHSLLHLPLSPPFRSQVKIWFQNRRAKERKINKKKLQQQQPPAPPAPQPPPPQPGPLRSVPEPLSPVSSLQGPLPGSVPGVLGPAGGVLNPTVTQ